MSSITGLNDTLKTLRQIKRATTRSKLADACYEAASEAAETAQTIYSMTDYDGDRNVSVTARKKTDGATITASGQAVLFMEFGAGIRYAGEQHPFNGDLGFGPGTYNPESPNWNNPNGWYFTDPVTRQKMHTYGNPPAMGMYQAGKEAREKATEYVRREIFGE